MARANPNRIQEFEVEYGVSGQKDNSMHYKDHTHNNMCQKYSQNKTWYCTRPKGHEGFHEAGRGPSTGICVARWR